jgi:hypothetical protein
MVPRGQPCSRKIGRGVRLSLRVSGIDCAVWAKPSCVGQRRADAGPKLTSQLAVRTRTATLVTSADGVSRALVGDLLGLEQEAGRTLRPEPAVSLSFRRRKGAAP